MPKKLMHELFGERFGEVLLEQLGSARKADDVRAACVTASKIVLKEFTERPKDKGGVGINLFFPFEHLGVSIDDEEGGNP